MTNFEKKLYWELKNEEHIIQDQWIDFRRNEYKLPDGQTISPVYNYSKHSFSLVVATDKDGKYICVRQYRHGIDEITTEFPAGGIEYAKEGEAANIEDMANASHNRMSKPPIQQDNNNKEPITKENIIASEDEAFEAAKRELREETGYTSDNWTHLLTIPANATISNSNVHIYCATDCTLSASQELDATEFLNVVTLSETELLSAINGGDFKQALHVLAYYLFKDKVMK
ncbi:NUDIX hydrolase [Butyrivibrio hungatei]|uniref:NUDIX hydrolase n=1 Tax=Butyrivibrio hungatei TaxID=185008 RepID=UPI0004033FBA|nr:NUDIX hydrolase [Butyrivibrio hungatei]